MLAATTAQRLYRMGLTVAEEQLVELGGEGGEEAPEGGHQPADNSRQPGGFALAYRDRDG